MNQSDSLIDFREILWKARQYRWLILLPIVVSLCAAFLFLKTAGRLYESRVVLSVADRPAVSRSLQSLVSPDRTSDRPSESVARINDRVHQTPFLLTLAGRLGISASPEVRAEAQSRAMGLEGVTADDLMRRMMTSRLGRKISVSPGTGSLVNVSVVDPDPRQARAIATEVVGLLVEQTRRNTLERAQARGAFSSDQIAVYQERLRKSEDALREFQESLIGRNIQASIINDDNLDLARTLIRTNTEEMRQIRDRIAGERQTWSAETGYEARMPDLTSTSTAGLEDRLGDLEINYALAQLGSQQSSATTAVIKSRVSEMRQDLYNEYLALAQQAPAASTEGARLAAAGIALDRSILRTLTRKGDRLSALVRAFGTSVQSSPRDKIELSRLEGAVAMNRQLLATLEQEVTSSRMSEALETSVLGVSIDIAEPAQVPLSPVFPNRNKTLAMALLLGPLIGVGLVFAIERLGGVVRSVEQAEKEIGVPVVGTVPRVEEWARPGGFLQNYWAPISIVLVLLATGIFYTIHSASHSREQRPPASSVGQR